MHPSYAVPLEDARQIQAAAIISSAGEGIAFEKMVLADGRVLRFSG